MQDVVLVRIYGNKTELLVDRENEVKSFRVLHAHRCAPRLYCTFNNGLCYEFLQGTALEPEHIRSQPVFRYIIMRTLQYIMLGNIASAAQVFLINLKACDPLSLSTWISTIEINPMPP